MSCCLIEVVSRQALRSTRVFGWTTYKRLMAQSGFGTEFHIFCADTSVSFLMRM